MKINEEAFIISLADVLYRAIDIDGIPEDEVFDRMVPALIETLCERYGHQNTVMMIERLAKKCKEMTDEKKSHSNRSQGSAH